ncbi:MAG: hypothetical protein AB1Z22_09400 [Synechococcaceae cyanobacterium]
MDSRDPTGAPTPEPLSTGRPFIPSSEGDQLLFGAAQDLARLQGALNNGNPPLFERSRLGRNSYALVDADDRVIARIPLDAARRRLKQRSRIARRVLRGPAAKLPAVARTGRGFTVHQLRLLDEEPRALAWAIGSGEPFPDGGSRLEQTLITVALLCLCVLPGLWYVSYRHGQWRQHQEAVRQLVARWRSKGRPDPPASFFVLYGS